MAFLYQDMPKCGTRGGTRLKLPVMDMCGSFSLGKLQEKLKKPLILSIALRTASRAALIGVSMPFLMALKIDVTVSLAAFIGFSIAVFTAENTVVTLDLIASTTVPIVDFMPLMMFETEDLIAFQICVAKLPIAVHPLFQRLASPPRNICPALSRFSPNALQSPLSAAVNAENSDEMTLVTVSNTVCTCVQIALRNVPSVCASSTSHLIASAMPCIAPAMVCAIVARYVAAYSHTAENKLVPD